jgi:hypothetical protein
MSYCSFIRSRDSPTTVLLEQWSWGLSVKRTMHGHVGNLIKLHADEGTGHGPTITHAAGEFN